MRGQAVVGSTTNLPTQLAALGLSGMAGRVSALLAQSQDELWSHEQLVQALIAAEHAQRVQASSGEKHLSRTAFNELSIDDGSIADAPVAETQVEVFPWTHRLETGIHSVDVEHRRLVDLLNHMAMHLGQRSDASVLNHIFHELASYADRHFKSEEACWAPAFGNDPWFIQHKRIHATFLQQVGDIQLHQNDRATEDLMSELLTFLIRWLAYHILEDDRLLARVVHARKEGLSLEEAKVRAKQEMGDSRKVFIETVLEMYQLLSGRTLDLMRERTERRRVNDHLRAAKAAAEGANRAKSEFLASMSHELRTPLNAIIGFSEVLQDGAFGELNPRQARYVGHVLTSGRHLLSLINDILDLSKVEAGRLELSVEAVSPASVLQSSMVLFKEKAQKHAITLSIDIEPSVRTETIQADERKFKQVCFNLLSNAMKFTPDGGKVTAHIGRYAEGVVLRVVDSGIGLAPDDLERIFRAFEQVDSSYGRQQQGTGLGLALTRRLVALHGGRVWAESDGAGKGATFVVEWPAAPRADETSR